MVKNIVAIIPARGGSKGLPGKNIRLLDGKPLIAYSIEVAKRSKYITRVIVTTDNEEIAEVSKKYGAEVPFLRPFELAVDNSSTESALKHTVDWLEENEGYTSDIVVFMQLTDFFKSSEWIDETIKCLLEDPDLDSAFIGSETHKNYWKRSGDKHARATPFTEYCDRHEKEPIFREDTGLGCSTRGSVIKKGNRLGENVKLIEKDYEFFDIHTKFDFYLLEKAIEWKKKN